MEGSSRCVLYYSDIAAWILEPLQTADEKGSNCRQSDALSEHQTRQAQAHCSLGRPVRFCRVERHLPASRSARLIITKKYRCARQIDAHGV